MVLCTMFFSRKDVSNLSNRAAFLVRVNFAYTKK